MKKIKILGAGLSGLTAAINLALAGYDVEVFERNSDCGMRFLGDLQGLENWSEKEDTLTLLSKMNIATDFELTPFQNVTFSNCRTSEEFLFNRPLFYLVTRGKSENSLDQSLKRQALNAGVKIHFDQTINENEADIVATGPQSKNIAVAAKGIVFKTNLPDLAIGIVNDQAAFKGYSYLLIANGKACLCSCVFDDIKKLTDCFEFTKKYFSQKYKLTIENPQKVGGIGYFSMNNTFKKGKTLYVGEAAGIQDFLAGFGMKAAIDSGYLAAKSIIENLDYVKLANDKFAKHIKAGIVNRYTWEHAGFDKYLRILKQFNRLNPSSNFLRSVYSFNLTQRLRYPLAMRYISKQYPEIQ